MTKGAAVCSEIPEMNQSCSASVSPANHGRQMHLLGLIPQLGGNKLSDTSSNNLGGLAWASFTIAIGRTGLSVFQSTWPRIGCRFVTATS